MVIGDKYGNEKSIFESLLELLDEITGVVAVVGVVRTDKRFLTPSILVVKRSMALEDPFVLEDSVNRLSSKLVVS